MYARHSIGWLVPLKKGKVTEVSVIPCRLIGGLHEWLNESATVPAWSPVKLTYWRTVQ